MEIKQTAVNFLIEKLDNNLDINHSWRTRQYIEQAKAMEKEQIKDAYKAGCVDEMWELNNTENEEHYYNKTFANDTTKGLPKEDSKRRDWHY